MIPTHPHDEDGMTLVELIVAVVVAGLVLAVVSIAFANGMIAQRDGVSRDAATGKVNVVASSLSTSIRNATTVRVAPDGARADATYVGPDGKAECRAWALVKDADGRNVLAYRADASSAPKPLPPADQSWGVLATDVTGTLTGGKLFASTDGKNLKWGMRIRVDVDADDHIDVAVADGATAQAVHGGVPTC